MIPAMPSEFTQATWPLALMRTPMDNSNVQSSTPPCFRGFTVRTAIPPPLKFVMRACCATSLSFKVTGKFTGCRKYRPLLAKQQVLRDGDVHAHAVFCDRLA